MRKGSWLAGLVLISIAAGLIAQTAANFNLRKAMSQAQFSRAGLDKLSPAELDALNTWISGFMAARQGQASAPPNPVRASFTAFADLEGAVIVADDGTFLGKITANDVDSDSILNDVGSYGSDVSRTSIFNDVGQYGGDISPLSPFNSISATPPKVFKGNQFVGYLTVNPVKLPRIDPRALIGWLKSQN